MRELIVSFPNQLKHAIEIGENSELVPNQKPISNVLICGLGGSGIGGKIMAQLVSDHCSIPVLTNNTYTIPHFVDQNTLVIISSYSGNTEETVQAMNEAHARGAQIAAITSGGSVLEMVKAHGYNHILIPGGHPPRSQFGYSIVSQLFLFHHYGLISDEVYQGYKSLPEFLSNAQDSIIAEAKAIAEAIKNKLPILYADDALEGVAVRWRQQLNENSKMLCWHHVFPELNHNELVGWDGGDERFVVLMLHSSEDHPRNQKRMEITKEWIEQKRADIVEIHAKGENRLQRMISLVNLGDWVSLLIAEQKGCDPVAIDAIDHLKSELAKLA